MGSKYSFDLFAEFLELMLIICVVCTRGPAEDRRGLRWKPQEPLLLLLSEA